MSQALPRCRALVCALVLLGGLAVAVSAVDGACDTSFGLTSFSYNNIHFISHSWLDADSHIRMAPGGRPPNASEVAPPQNALGQAQAMHKETVTLVDPQSKIAVSFSTSFAFTMTTGRKSTSAGDGIAFIVVPVEEAVETIPGGHEVTGPNYDVISSAQWNLLAVQLHKLDTKSDLQLGGDRTNFSGSSTASTNVDDLLTDGAVAVAWIDFDARTSQLQVRVSNTTTRPVAPVVDRKLDLAGVFLEKMFIGFSTPVWVTVHWWNFTSSCLGSQLPKDISTSTQSSSTTFFPFTMLNDTKADDPSGKELIILVASVLAGALLLLLLLCYVLVKICRIVKARRRLVRGPVHGADQGPRIFAYKDLSLATQGFNSNALLGRGGFGSVYKGTLEGGTPVAVKRIEPNNAKNGERQFIAEVASIGRLRHRNLVQLQGWCHEKGELLLVYDFMPNGSLDRLLFGKQRAVFPWESRFNIVQGVASALAYLHVGWEKQVVHRDVKASNVLLDHNYQPRLGDFGLARMVDHNKAPLSTTVAGTYGYLAPEIAYTGKATDKTDVFSFGALALEVACGRRPIERKLPPDEINLVDWVWGLHSKGELLNAVDSRLQRGTFDTIQVATVLSVGLLCSHPDPTTRPHMRQVVQILRGDFGCPPVPATKPIVIHQPQQSLHDPRGPSLTNNKSRVADSSSSLLNSGRSVSTTDSSTSTSSQSPLHQGPSSHLPTQDNSR
ncbi:protein MpRLK-Pelle_L-LEC22 [Marchantia polymorpha subsp. ruderalis]|uniref:Protein kinase domain-containing protein n=2 Tax=Marchantia polymorpha TaxID=3197 RepID=A0AAF6BGK0_MARPO|nr:hypothetical protein MARPO_0095s0026 [Marchantia polymorpha]BBN11134.1 hypothetical protein Mp_5g09340 [Marchantia polymorpha subsp. ruderalis]|eukprot:PTQ32764.1 hypothetical protein MARPO_0095s0026 [Marchantia polymorpha]